MVGATLTLTVTVAEGLVVVVPDVVDTPAVAVTFAVLFVVRVVCAMPDASVFTTGPLREPASVVKVTDRKSTRLNSSHGYISYAVFCLKKKKKKHKNENAR